MNLSYFVFKVAGIVCIGMGIWYALYTIVSAPSRVAGRLGLRGLKRQRAIANNESWAQFEPLVRWLGVRVSGILSEEQYAKLDEEIALAGDYMGLTAEELFAMMIIGGLVGSVGGVMFGLSTEFGPVLGLIVGPVGFSLPYMQVSGYGQERLKQVSRGLPYTVDLMSLCMGAGLDFPGSVRQVIEKSSNPDDPIVEEFTLLSQSLQLGRSRKESLLEFARRSPCEAVKEFTGALIQAEERGNPVADVLQIQASASRMRRSVRAEENAAKAGVQMVGPLMLVFGCVMCLIIGPMMLTMGKM